MQLDWVKHTTDCVLYISYIGNGLVKIGYSDGKFLIRDLKHQSCEAEYPQWRTIKLLQISGASIEKIIHELLVKYKAIFNKQKEIYKPPGKLREFIKLVEELLHDNDLKLRVQNLERENMELRLKLAQYSSTSIREFPY